ncbi:glycoside hydrolase family 88 protein [Erysipelothrix sp. Poltava]|nr:glycoside hydrolase family 88 protein [Erysipelothrix sp. Poltava]
MMTNMRISQSVISTRVCQYVIRDDASAFHTFYMDPETGGPVRGATRQGYNDESSWARGQGLGCLWNSIKLPLYT